MPTSNKTGKSKSQREKFIESARELEADESEEASKDPEFLKVVRRMLKTPPKPHKPSGKRKPKPIKEKEAPDK